MSTPTPPPIPSLSHYSPSPSAVDLWMARGIWERGGAVTKPGRAARSIRAAIKRAGTTETTEGEERSA